jgi:hypothetical protein
MPIAKKRTRPRPMSPGEKMIWAAAYAKYYDLSSPAPGLVNDAAKWKEWESAQVHGAIEFAGYAVENAREHLGAVKDGFGATSSTYLMLKAVLG